MRNRNVCCLSVNGTKLLTLFVEKWRLIFVGSEIWRTNSDAAVQIIFHELAHKKCFFPFFRRNTTKCSFRFSALKSTPIESKQLLTKSSFRAFSFSKASSNNCQIPRKGTTIILFILRCNHGDGWSYNVSSLGGKKGTLFFHFYIFRSWQIEEIEICLTNMCSQIVRLIFITEPIFRPIMTLK